MENSSTYLSTKGQVIIPMTLGLSSHGCRESLRGALFGIFCDGPEASGMLQCESRHNSP